MLKKMPSAFERVSGVRAKLPEAVSYDGFKWIVGSGSRNAEYPINLSDLKYFYPLVVKEMMRRGWIKEGEEIGVSLPAETWYEDKLSGFKFCEGIKDDIRKETGVEVEVLPQGVIALQKIYEEGKLSEEGRTLVIDGGFNTVNTAIVFDGEIVYTKTYYNEFGIRDLLENYFRPEIKQKYPEATSNLQRLKEVFLKEKIDAGLVVIDVKNEKMLALNNFIDALFRRIIRDIERAGESFEQFTIVGGLSYYVPEIETNKPYFIPEKNGEFYTAAGMCEYLSASAIDFGFGDIKICIKGEE